MNGDRGAVLVHVAIALVAVLAFTVFVIDFGALWVSRRQAQNAADAGALAGALGLAFDNPLDRGPGGPAVRSALGVARRNYVWGQAPSVLESDVTFVTCPDGSPDCVRVDVYRNTDRGNPLPVFMGPLLGLESQNIRATATAESHIANASSCLKPWGLADKWAEHYPVDGAPWTPTSTFDKYDARGNLLPNPDVYIPPSAAGSGTSFTLEADYGIQARLKVGSPSEAITPGWFSPLRLTGTGGSEYRTNISGCAGQKWGIADEIPIEPGNMVGPTRQGVQDLIDLDPGAHWVGGLSPIAGSCVTAGTCPQFTMSPRIVAVPVFDVDVFVSSRHSGHARVVVRNILGFFIDGFQGNDVLGHLMTGPGIYDPELGPVPPGAAFLRAVWLVR
jgi:hypothetical protein